MLSSQHRLSFVSLLRRAGPSTVVRKAVEQTWWTKLFLGVRCDLASLPPIRPAKFEITMKPCESGSFTGFAEELERVRGTDYIDVFLRQSMCQAGVQTLYAAPGPDGSPAYVQWLVTARTQHLLHSHQPGRYPTLQPDEVLLEGAYTFIRFRRTGVMADGMAQLLRIAKAGGARAAFMYVASDNVASLRGCANVGFILDHARMNKRRVGLRWSSVRSVDEWARKLWITATSPHPSA